jgi:hypothetical protein
MLEFFKRALAPTKKYRSKETLQKEFNIRIGEKVIYSLVGFSKLRTGRIINIFEDVLGVYLSIEDLGGPLRMISALPIEYFIIHEKINEL